MSVRKITFLTSYKAISAGSGIDTVGGLNASFSANVLGEHGADNIDICAPNIQITVPDNWGDSVQSPVAEEDGGISSFKQTASSFDLTVIFKADGDIKKYYQLFDGFTRTWANGLFTIEVNTGSFHGGKQYVDGYISNMTHDEFRTNADVFGKATFVPTSSWYFKFGNDSDSVKFGDCPLNNGKTVSTVSGVKGIPTSLFEVQNLQNLSAAGIKFYCADPGDSFFETTFTIAPNDFAKSPAPVHYDIVDGIMYGHGAQDGTDSDGSPLFPSSGQVALPKYMTGVTMNADATAKSFKYCEQYAT